ncbi:unnamed protein product [Durusdinium trenchii]|uniref:HEAT repeat domain-containing protein n=1 Tax=Durusdinium trenchii TaxID=1381693 RepID=A0ABP0KAH2_9DINO
MKSADPQEIKSIIQGLASRDEGERNSVAWKLQRAADADELVVAELVRHLCDEHPPVRRSAQRTLREVVPQSCDVVLPLLLSRTGTANAGGRMEVLKALEHFAERGDARVTKAMLARLADAEASVRAQALSSLAVCAEEDDDRVLTQVLERLEDVDEHVRGAVAKALPSVASRGNHQVMRCLARLCRNEKPPPQRETLKEAACRALATFAPGDAEAISLVGECIHEDYPQASIAALKALLLLVPSGDHHGLDTVAGALRHPDLQLREMATHVTWSPRKESDGIWNDLKAYA